MTHSGTLAPVAGAPARSILVDGRATLTADAPRGPLRVVHVGSFPPRACGIATYTRDVAESVALRLGVGYDVVAVEDERGAYRYERPPLGRIVRDEPGSYVEAARAVNRSGAQVVDLQHEYGLFGGPSGEDVLRFLERLGPRVVTTLHTTLPQPEPELRRVTQEIAARSAGLVVLAHSARDILEAHYGIPRAWVRVIPHGVPTFEPGEPVRRRAKERLGLAGRTVLSTFGLLGRGKGIEEALRALPAIVALDPTVVYVVAGATHPGVLREEGETYRESLRALVDELGLARHVRFDNRYLPYELVIRYLEATDVYVMAYHGRHQVVSGTLAYALGAGRAVVATPFTFAREVLPGGRGLLVPFADAPAIANAVCRLLAQPEERAAIERRAYALGRRWQWPQVAGEYGLAFEQVA
jgi:glycosyltransferase involved in cell wall biosynthesis